MKRLQRTLVGEPALLRSLCDENLRLKNNMRYQLDHAALGNDRYMTASTARCSCSRLPYTKETCYKLLEVSIFRLNMTSHCDACPFSKMAKRTKSLGVRYAICSYLLSFSVQATLSVVTGAGGLSISPRLSFRNIVRWDSPAFELLRSLGILLLNRKKLSNLTASRYLDSTLKQLRELFSERKASPMDVSCPHTIRIRSGAIVDF
jgi:hypothetical protein